MSGSAARWREDPEALFREYARTRDIDLCNRLVLCRVFSSTSQREVPTQLCISQMHVSRLERRALRTLKALLSSPPGQTVSPNRV